MTSRPRIGEGGTGAGRANDTIVALQHGRSGAPDRHQERSMSLAEQRRDPGTDLMTLMEAARAAADALLNDAVFRVRERVSVNGRSDAGLIDREQRATHGLAWFATYAEAIRQLGSYTERMSRNGRLGETEELLGRIRAGEFLAPMAGGIPMSQGELVRPADLGLDARAVAARLSPAVAELISTRQPAHNPPRLTTPHAI